MYQEVAKVPIKNGEGPFLETPILTQQKWKDRAGWQLCFLKINAFLNMAKVHGDLYPYKIQSKTQNPNTYLPKTKELAPKP